MQKTEGFLPISGQHRCSLTPDHFLLLALVCDDLELYAESNWSGPDNPAVRSDWNFKIREKEALFDLEVDGKVVCAFDKCTVQTDIFNGVSVRPARSTILGDNGTGNSSLFSQLLSSRARMRCSSIDKCLTKSDMRLAAAGFSNCLSEGTIFNLPSEIWQEMQRLN
jgi:hypothetical protein